MKQNPRDLVALAGRGKDVAKLAHHGRPLKKDQRREKYAQSLEVGGDTPACESQRQPSLDTIWEAGYHGPF